MVRRSPSVASLRDVIAFREVHLAPNLFVRAYCGCVRTRQESQACRQLGTKGNRMTICVTSRFRGIPEVHNTKQCKIPCNVNPLRNMYQRPITFSGGESVKFHTDSYHNCAHGTWKSWKPVRGSTSHILDVHTNDAGLAEFPRVHRKRTGLLTNEEIFPDLSRNRSRHFRPANLITATKTHGKVWNLTHITFPFGLN